jgi:predicted alpha/beta-fold hydrolase
LTWCLPPEFALGTLNQDTVKLATAKLFFMRYPWWMNWGHAARIHAVLLFGISGSFDKNYSRTLNNQKNGRR